MVKQVLNSQLRTEPFSLINHKKKKIPESCHISLETQPHVAELSGESLAINIMSAAALREAEL